MYRYFTAGQQSRVTVKIWLDLRCHTPLFLVKYSCSNLNTQGSPCLTQKSRLPLLPLLNCCASLTQGTNPPARKNLEVKATSMINGSTGHGHQQGGVDNVGLPAQGCEQHSRCAEEGM